MSDTPRTDAAEIVQIFVNHPELRTNRVPVEFARQLERELAETAKDYRCLAELLDGHDATECRANLRKLKDAVQTLNDCADYLNRRLAEERALADRLATWAQEHRNAYMGQVPHVDCGCGDCQILPVLDADLAAWKEARRE